MAFRSESSTSRYVAIDPEKAQRLAMLFVENDGKKKPTKTAIIAEVWGVSGGRRYMAASLEYEAVVSSLIDLSIEGRTIERASMLRNTPDCPTFSCDLY